MTGAKEWIYEYLFAKALPIFEDFGSTREQESSNQLRLLGEGHKQMEQEVWRYKQELNNEKENCFRKLQDQETERIQKKTENAFLTEKNQNLQIELEELRKRCSTEYTEKLF